MKIRTRGHAYQSLAINAIASDFSNYHLIERKDRFNHSLDLVDCPAELDGGIRQSASREGSASGGQGADFEQLSTRLPFIGDCFHYLRPVPLQPVVKSFETAIGKSKSVQDIIAIQPQPSLVGSQICLDPDYSCPVNNCFLQFCDQLNERCYGEISPFDKGGNERLSSPIPVQPCRLPQEATIPDNRRVVNNSNCSRNFYLHLIKRSKLKSIGVMSRAKDSHKKDPINDVLFHDEFEISQHIIGKYFGFMEYNEERLGSHGLTSQASESNNWLEMKKKTWMSQRIFLRSKYIVENSVFNVVNPLSLVADKRQILEKCIRLDPFLPKETNDSVQEEGKTMDAMKSSIAQPTRTHLPMINVIGIKGKMSKLLKRLEEKENGVTPLYNRKRNDDETQAVGRSSSIDQFLASEYFSKQGVQFNATHPKSVEIELSARPSKILLDIPLPFTEDATKPKSISSDVILTANFPSVSYLRVRRNKSCQDVTSNHQESHLRIILQQRSPRAINIRNVINIGKIMTLFSLKKGIFIPHTNGNDFSGNFETCDGQANSGCIRRHSLDSIFSRFLDGRKKSNCNERKCVASFVTKKHPNLNLQRKTPLIEKNRKRTHVNSIITSEAISALVGMPSIENSCSPSSKVKPINTDTFSILQSLESLQKLSVTNRGELLHLATKAVEIKNFGVKNDPLKPSSLSVEDSFSIKLPPQQPGICLENEYKGFQKDNIFNNKKVNTKAVDCDVSSKKKHKKKKRKRKRKNKKYNDESYMKKTKKRRKEKQMDLIENPRSDEIEVRRIAVPTIHVGFTPMVVKHESYEVTSLHTGKEGSSCQRHILNQKKSTTSIKLLTSSCTMNKPTEPGFVSNRALEESREVLEQNPNLEASNKRKGGRQDTKDEARVTRPFVLNEPTNWRDTSPKRFRPIRDLTRSTISAKNSSNKGIFNNMFSDRQGQHDHDHDMKGELNQSDLDLSLGRNFKSTKIGKQAVNNPPDDLVEGNFFTPCRGEEGKSFDDQIPNERHKHNINNQDCKIPSLEEREQHQSVTESRSLLCDDVLPGEIFLFNTKGGEEVNFPVSQDKCNRTFKGNIAENNYSSIDLMGQFNATNSTGKSNPVKRVSRISPSESVPIELEHNSQPGTDGFSLLCSENFLEELSMTATELSSGHWCDSFATPSNDESSRLSMTKVTLRDCALVDEAGIDIEVSIGTAIKIIKMSSWNGHNSGKDSTRNLVSVASCGRYDMVFVLLVMDVSDPTRCLNDIVSLQNATVKQNGCTCDQIRFQYVSASLLSPFIMNIVKQHYDFFNKACQWLGENTLDEHQIDIIQFVLSIVPTMTVLDAIGLITFDRQRNSLALVNILNPLHIRQIQSKDETKIIIKKRSAQQLAIALQVPIGKLIK